MLYLAERMKFIICLNVLFILANCMQAQLPDPSWHYTIDAFNDADISDLEVDQQGNTYVAVNYVGVLDLEGNNGRLLANAPHMHGLLAKLGPTGKLLWCHGFKSAFDNRINDIAVGADGSVFITGFGDGLMLFPGKSDVLTVGRERAVEGYHQPQGLYVARYNSDGERGWVNYWSTSWGEGKSVAVNSKGEVVMSYYHYSNLTNGDLLIDNFERTPGVQAKVSLAFFQPNGSLKGLQPFQIWESDGTVRSPQLRFDEKDNLYVFGLFRKALKLSETDSLINDGYYESEDSYLVKYNSEGLLLWKRQFGGQNIQILKDIDFAHDGSLYGTGFYFNECILMGDVQSAQKSKVEYKSGNSMFYFHLFDDGETDFIQFEECSGYDGYLSGHSIDHDVNGESHIVGAFNDTLRINGFQLTAQHYPNVGYLSSWMETELTLLKETALLEKSWIVPNHIRSSDQNYAIGANYYGDGVKMQIGGKDVKLSFKDYGRGSVVYGGSINNRNVDNEVLAEIKERRRSERLRSLEPFFNCSDPGLADDPATWFVVSDLGELTIAPSVPIVPPANPTSFEPLTSQSPCGVQLDDLGVILFPNPTRGMVSVKLKGMEGSKAQIDVFSDQGQLVYSQGLLVPANDHIVDFDMTAAAAGTYIVRIVYGDFAKGLRLVKT
jgi:hypothetical protein